MNIDLAPVDYKTDRRATIAIGVDKIDVTRTALSDQLVDWMIPEPALADPRPGSDRCSRRRAGLPGTASL